MQTGVVKVVLPKGVVPSMADILHLYGVEIEWCEPSGGMRGAIETRIDQCLRHHVTPSAQPALERSQLAVPGSSESMIRKAFETAYLASFSRLLPGLAIRIVSLRVAAIGRRPAFRNDKSRRSKCRPRCRES